MWQEMTSYLSFMLRPQSGILEIQFAYYTAFTPTILWDLRLLVIDAGRMSLQVVEFNGAQEPRRGLSIS